MEEQSVNTRQNLRNSLPLLERQGFDSYGGRLAVITNGFHMARVGLLWDLPTELVQVPAKLPWWLDANYYLRESFAIVNDMCFARCWPEYIYPARFFGHWLWGGKWSAAP